MERKAADVGQCKIRRSFHTLIKADSPQVIEKSIMIGTHVGAILANALERGFLSFDIVKAWAGVKKNAYVTPSGDTELLCFDKEGYTPIEVRAVLTEYMPNGYISNDQWAESASRALDYGFDDCAASVAACHAGDDTAFHDLKARSQDYHTLYNATTTFMEARNANGTWTSSDQGWTA